jgi:putative transposase
LTLYTSSVESLESKDVTTSLGVDFNTKGNTCFVALKDSGLAFPVGVSLRDVSINYTNRVAKLQSKAKFSPANKLSRKRFRVMDDNYHKVSRQIVDLAVENNAGIVLEDLTGLRKGKVKKEFGKSSWGFYKLRQFIEYKAKLAGIPVQFVSPRNTTRTCSKCGHVHDKPISGKVFNCKNCGYNSHRDLNAAFNIAALGHFESTSKELDLEEGCQTCQPEQVEFLEIRKRA